VDIEFSSNWDGLWRARGAWAYEGGLGLSLWDPGAERMVGVRGNAFEAESFCTLLYKRGDKS